MSRAEFALEPTRPSLVAVLMLVREFGQYGLVVRQDLVFAKSVVVCVSVRRSAVFACRYAKRSVDFVSDLRSSKRTRRI